MNEEAAKIFISDVVRRELSSRGLTLRKLLLFGSRARGDARKHSDWDFLVVTDKPVDWSLKREIWYALSIALSEKDIAADFIIKSEAEFDQDKDDTGKLTYYAVKEGAYL